MSSRSHLLNDRTAEHYRRSVTEGVERVADQTRRHRTARSPASPPSELAPADLRHRPGRAAGRPRRRPRRAGEGLPPRRRLLPPPALPRPPQLPGGHPGGARRGRALRRQLLAGHLGPERRRHPHRAPAHRLDRRPHRPRPRRRRRLHQRRHPVQPPGAAARPRGGVPTGAEELRDAARKPEILPRLRILTSEGSHFSVAEGRRSCSASAPRPSSPCPCDQRPADAHRPRSPRELERCEREGLVAMAVVATAGTTDFGSIDPLPEIAELCAAARRPGCTWTPRTAAGCWSPDAAGTCSTASSAPTRSPSTTTSPSSSRSVPAPCWSATRRRCGTPPTTRTTSTRARMAEKRIPNQVDKSLQTTRRFDALKLWLTLRIMGADGVGELFDEVVRPGRRRPGGCSPPTRASRSSPSRS